jgi:segregation and condensation protein A
MSLILKQAAFEGPFDLLLQLIEDEELQITEVSLAEVTDQYLGHVKQLSRENLPEISDYLVIAARLVLIKSRALLPTEVTEDEEPDDLAAQLAEYKRFKEMAANFSQTFEAGRYSYGKSPSKLPKPEGMIADGVDLEGLHKAFVEILDRLPEPVSIPEETLEEQLTIEQCIDTVRTAIQTGPVQFKSLFSDLKSRVQMIVTFLAVLELIKQSTLRVQPDAPQLTLVAA